MTPLLTAHNLTVRRGPHVVVDHVSFEVAAGETVAIIGPNGSGKTTLLKTLMGLIAPSEGGVHWNEKPRFGYVPQRLELEPGFPLTVEELLLLRMGARPLWRHDKAAHNQVMNELRRVGAERVVEKRMSELSGGELQRVLIAAALTGKPTVLCLDEPSSGIDNEGEEAIYSLIHRLADEEHLTVLLVSHDLDVVFRHATKVVCINKKLMCAGVPSKVLTPDVIEKAYAGSSSYAHNHRSPHSHDA